MGESGKRRFLGEHRLGFIRSDVPAPDEIK
jgi:hypothetical protein